MITIPVWMYVPSRRFRHILSKYLLTHKVAYRKTVFKITRHYFHCRQIVVRLSAIVRTRTFLTAW